jgi:diguanylate cyclase
MDHPRDEAPAIAGTDSAAAPEAIPYASFAAAARAVFASLAGLEETSTNDLMVRLLATIMASEAQVESISRRAERAETDSLIDPLTGLANRRGWIRAISIEEARCRRFNLPASIAVLDLDDLKAVNDSQGHAAGDDMLRNAARTIVSETRAHDIVARLGGDEFGVLAVNCDRSAAEALGLRLSTMLRAEGIKASIGMESLDQDTDLESLWKRADKAMYRIKHSRKPDLTITGMTPRREDVR